MAEDLPPAMREETGSGSEEQVRRPHGAEPAPLPRPHSESTGGRPDRSQPHPARNHDARFGGAPTFASASSAQRQAFAAIDLGTNNCRLLIARPQGENFVVIDAFSRVVRLGEGLAQTGRLSDAAMERTLGALHICADKLRRRNVYLARSVAMVLFLWAPLTPNSVYIFSAVMGVLWLSTVPPTNAVVAQIFGVAHLSMLGGFVFFSHQIGSFMGVWLGGFLYDKTGSYDIVWYIAIALGVFAALVNLPVRETAIARGPQRMGAAA